MVRILLSTTAARSLRRLYDDFSLGRNLLPCSGCAGRGTRAPFKLLQSPSSPWRLAISRCNGTANMICQQCVRDYNTILLRRSVPVSAPGSQTYRGDPHSSRAKPPLRQLYTNIPELRLGDDKQKASCYSLQMSSQSTPRSFACNNALILRGIA